jgi:hypothetical protein
MRCSSMALKSVSSTVVSNLRCQVGQQLLLYLVPAQQAR